MATIELNDDTLYTAALPAGARLFGAQSAAATEPTSFGREAIYNYVSAALSPVASSGSATDLTSGTLPLGRLHAWLADISSIASPATNDVIYFDGTDFVSGPITGLVSAFDDALEAAQEAASDAEASATAAASSASAASTSASNASTSASNASTSASNASTSATNASNSASAASTSATNAASSATTAVAAAGFTHTYSTTTTMADPGPGGVRFNSLTLASITAAAIDDLSATGQDISARVTSWADSTNTTDKGRLLFRKGSTFWAEFKVTGLTDNSGWTELALDYVGHEGTLSNSDDLVSSFSPTGDEGASGGGTGDVTAASSFGTDNRVVRSDGSGKGVQASGITVDDSDVVTGVTRITASHATGYAGRFVNTQDAASFLEVARFEGDRATPGDGDSMQIGFYLSNDAGTQVEAARMTWALTDVSAGTEDSALFWMLQTGGSPENFLRLDNTGLSPASNNLIALGTSSLGWADAFFALGAVVDFDNGDVTFTHSANTITMAGGTLVLPASGLQVGASNPFSDSAGTLTLQNVDAIDATTRGAIETGLLFTQSGTGATARTIASKLREQIHVKDYGCVGDGTTDDTANLQAAINYAVSVGGEVLLGQGKYRITGATGLVIDESAMTADDDATRVSIIGEGAGASQIVHNGTGPAITYQGGSTSSGPHAYLRLDGFRIDGTNGTGQHGIKIDNAAYFSMEDVTIYECDTALNLTDVLSFQVSSSVFRYNATGVVASYVSFSRPNNITFEDCVFGLNSTAAAVFNGAGLVRFRGGSVERCGTNASGATGGIFVVNSGVESGIGLVCEDVYFENNHGDCDVSFDETSNSVLHVLRGCTFQQFQSPHVTNSVLMACSSGVGLRVAVEGCNFSNVGGYTGSFAAFSTSGAAGSAWSLNIEPDTRFDSYITQPTASARITYGLHAPSVTNHGVALFTSTPGLTASTGAGTAGQVLISNGSSSDPTFQAVSQVFNGTTGLIGSPLAAGSTTYIGSGPQSQSATEFHVYFVIPKSGTLKNMYVYTDGAPGVGQTYTFTLRVGLADTSVVATISGNASNSANDTTHTAAVAAGDRASIKCVTSGTAATISNVLWAMTFESP